MTQSSKRTTDYYEILNVSPNSTKTQIREAYIRLKNTFAGHSQALYSLMSEEESMEMLRQVEEAFNVLKDDLRRKHYDAEMGWAQPDTVLPDTPSFTPSTAEFSSTPTTFAEVEVGEAVGPAAPMAMNKMRPTNLTGAISAANADNQDVRSKIKDAIANSAEPCDGALLRKLRELAGVNEAEIQERTKIALDSIRYIENNNFDKLPSKVFVKGFLKSYLRYLKVQDSEQLISAYISRFEAWQLAKTANNP